jgi:hypothetical protein
MQASPVSQSFRARQLSPAVPRWNGVSLGVSLEQLAISPLLSMTPRVKMHDTVGPRRTISSIDSVDVHLESKLAASSLLEGRDVHSSK